jgi:hypothetical protein
MDTLTITSVALALAGVVTAWWMHRRARRAEAEADNLRDELRADRGPTANPEPPTNQRPWPTNQPGPRRWPPPG